MTLRKALEFYDVPKIRNTKEKGDFPIPLPDTRTAPQRPTRMYALLSASSIRKM